MRARIGRTLLFCSVVIASGTACKEKGRRQDPKDAAVVDVGDGFTAQCSGWFPDWVSPSPPPAGTPTFQLSQGYPLGVPIFEETEGGEPQIVRWDPFPPSTSVAESPWLAHDFHVPAEREAYVNALRDYILEGNVEVDFDVGRNKVRSWYHVPMMTSDGFSRREPYKGLTRERNINDTDHKWLANGKGDLGAYAVGMYNWLGGYTIGQVFHDPDPKLADPSKAKFIPGAVVFKLLFAEYDDTGNRIDPDPFDEAPEWDIQDGSSQTVALKKVRLLQVDVAVRDDRAAETGWVFATFVYDETMTGLVPWRRLRAVGLQWGNDADVTAANVGTLDESWLGPGVPDILMREDKQPFGLNGRLNGPVDNPNSACMSCHGTAQVVTTEVVDPNAPPAEQRAGKARFRGAVLVPPSNCAPADKMTWFRNVGPVVAFGVMNQGGRGCLVASPAIATPPLHSVDYSLQLADALEESLYMRVPNPCAALAATLRDVEWRAKGSGDGNDMLKANELREELGIDKLRDIDEATASRLPLDVERQTLAKPQTVKVEPSKAETETLGAGDETGEDPHRR